MRGGGQEMEHLRDRCEDCLLREGKLSGFCFKWGALVPVLQIHTRRAMVEGVNLGGEKRWLTSGRES